MLHEVVAEPSPGGGPPSDKDGGGALRRQQRASTAGIPGLAAKPAVQRSQGEAQWSYEKGERGRGLFGGGLTDECRFVLFVCEIGRVWALLCLISVLKEGSMTMRCQKSFGSSCLFCEICAAYLLFFLRVSRAPLCPTCVRPRERCVRLFYCIDRANGLANENMPIFILMWQESTTCFVIVGFPSAGGARRRLRCMCVSCLISHRPTDQ